MEIQTPECDKALAIQDKSQSIGAFLDWLNENGIQLCNLHKHTDSCYAWGKIKLPADGKRSWPLDLYHEKYTDEKWLDCGYHESEFISIHESFEKLLARYFNIDLDKVEKEKQAILKAIRNH